VGPSTAAFKISENSYRNPESSAFFRQALNPVQSAPAPKRLIHEVMETWAVDVPSRPCRLTRHHRQDSPPSLIIEIVFFDRSPRNSTPTSSMHVDELMIRRPKPETLEMSGRMTIVNGCRPPSNPPGPRTFAPGELTRDYGRRRYRLQSRALSARPTVNMIATPPPILIAAGRPLDDYPKRRPA